MTDTPSLAIVLAAGKGTRMKSASPKVMHAIACEPMVAHVTRTAQSAGIGHCALVLAPGMDAVAKASAHPGLAVEVHVQTEQLGTAHAVMAARGAYEKFPGPVVVLYGDTPLLTARTVARVLERLGSGADLVVLGFRAADPAGYGRLILDGKGDLAAIREDKDASAEEKKIDLCNSGVFGFRGGVLAGLLERIGNDNAKGEYYLTDAVEIARGDGLKAEAVECDEREVLGVNSRDQLADAESELQQRLRRAAMEGGATLVAPETVFLASDTRLGRDVVVEPFVFFGPGVTVEDGATIRGFCHLEQSRIGAGTSVGPFARLRGGADIGANARIGNFVELKNATFGEGAKASHLTYVGDASVGSKANIGAGTITCNYDGFTKSRTEIGEGAFIGSNSALVAPVKIGEGAYVGSGSVISKDVPADALAVTRGPLTQLPHWASRMRSRKQAKKGNKE
ncbi:MAG: bifunctional UDP-N-acetylglucosamine diphosphorylase/glucosamine-1-phosphate N-acetyltransferase GlmU [Hyphomicrobiales bacterium]